MSDGGDYDRLEAPDDEKPALSELDLPLLRGEFKGWGPCAPFYGDLQWAAMETHVMIMLYCYPHSFADAPMGDQLNYWSVGYNPVYWSLLVCGMPCVLAGRWVHAMVGQGGPVRHDELEVEHEARVQWIYMTDGPFAAAALFTLVELRGGNLALRCHFTSSVERSHRCHETRIQP